MHPYLQKKQNRLRIPVSVEVQVASFLSCISVEGRHRKTTNAFGISRASVLAIIRKVSYIITTFLGQELIKLPTTKELLKKLTNKLLGTQEFPQCIGTTDDTYIEIAELHEHYSDYINRKGYYSLNVRALCDYKYCFQNVVI